jgi:hypothetical protein
MLGKNCLLDIEINNDLMFLYQNEIIRRSFGNDPKHRRIIKYQILNANNLRNEKRKTETSSETTK